MGDHLDDLVSADAVLDRFPKVEGKLVRPIERDQAGDRDQAAVALAQALAAPDLADRTVSVISASRGAMSPQGARCLSLAIGLAPV